MLRRNENSLVKLKEGMYILKDLKRKGLSLRGQELKNQLEF